MSERYVVVNLATEKVVNIIMWDGVAQWAPPDGTAAYRSDTVEIGDDWKGRMTSGRFQGNAVEDRSS